MLRQIALAGLLLTATAAQAANFLPLSPGNHWAYHSEDGQSFEITVGLTPIVFGDGRVFHKITGYANRPLYVRADADKVFWLNEEQQREEILTDFEPLSGAFYTTAISAPCEQDAQAQQRPVPFDEFGGAFTEAREIRYRILACADVGIENELYIENLGLVQRTIQTIAGPRVFKLASAKVGALIVNANPGVQFRVSLPSSTLIRSNRTDAVATEVTLQLLVDRLDAVKLRFLTSQRYDIAVKDERGQTVWLWSAAALFAPVVSEERVLSKEYVVPIALSLPDGQYQLEAWLTADSPGRPFAATATVNIATDGAEPAKAKSASFRVRGLK